MKPARLERSDFDSLIDALRGQGYRVLGPQVKAGAIVCGELNSTAQLPRGIKTVQAPGNYRLEDSGGSRLFDFVNSSESLQRLLFALQESLWTVSANGEVH